MKQNLQFPQGFLWGAATAAHQVEGNNHNDWSEWEIKNAKRLAQASSSQFFAKTPQWSTFQQQATDPKNYISGLACDHYNRFEEDFDIIQELGHTAHRFSLEWSRIEPSEGVFDQEALTHYRHVLQALKKRGVTPFVTLWHWTLPLWLSEKGGIIHKDFPLYFKKYTETVAQALGEDVVFWVTLNEPDVMPSHSYMKGAWTPQKKNVFLYIQSLLSLVAAHKQSYTIIKQLFPHAQIGIAKHQIVFEVARNTFVNRLLQKTIHYAWNCWFLDRINHYQDFIGLNHYNRNVIDNGFSKNPNKCVTDFGWEFCPESLYTAISELKPYNKPIYITENGIADASDILRQEFIPKALEAMHRAIADGADVRGYMYWSLLDNFEWDKGYWLRFGLVAVDYTTQARTIRPSALAYAEVCKKNMLQYK